MRTRTALLATAVAATLLAGCSDDSPSKEEVVQDCIKALKARAKGDKSKPEPCEPLEHEEYTLIVMSKVIRDAGVVDENGDVDMEKLIEPDSTDPELP